jgi:cytochrome c oxidase subunit 2
MTKKYLMVKRIPLIALTGLLLSACGFVGPQNAPVNPEYNNPGQGQYSSNGQRIYFTATDQSGQQIAYSGGPGFGGMMMGNYLTCAACHSADGHGGTQTIHMQTIDAPPIYYDALVKMKQDDSGGTPEAGGYTLDDFRGEVVGGHDIDGTPLDPNMPRWQMSDRDLQDLLDYLKTLH